MSMNILTLETMPLLIDSGNQTEEGPERDMCTLLSVSSIRRNPSCKGWKIYAVNRMIAPLMPMYA